MGNDGDDGKHGRKRPSTPAIWRGVASGAVALALLGAGVVVLVRPTLLPFELDAHPAALGASGALLIVLAIATVWRSLAIGGDDGGVGEEEGRTLALAKIDGYRATFDECVRRAEGTAPDAVNTKKAFVDGVRGAFDDIKRQVHDARAEEELQILSDSAEELERLRAYVIPKHEILIDGQTKLADMYEWGVPASVMDKLTLETVPMLSATDEARARAALRTIYENFDYWDWYVEDHAESMRIAGGVLLGLMLVSLTGAVMLLHTAHVYSGVFCAGLAGALLSVVAKLPPVLGYGAANAYVARIMSRVGVGVAASMIGMGLLASGIISVELPAGVSVADMLDGKDLAEPVAAEPKIAARAAAKPASPTQEPARPPPLRDGGVDPSPLATAPQPPAVAGAGVAAPVPPPSAAVPVVASAPTPQVPVQPTCGPACVAEGDAVCGAGCEPRNRRFSRRAVLLILALAMLFGFSERALSTFEDRVLPSRVVVPEEGKRPPPAPAVPAVPAPPASPPASVVVPPAAGPGAADDGAEGDEQPKDVPAPPKPGPVGTA